MKTDNLSLCIINKNDEKNLVRLIEKALPFMGEIIVVDTGSTDNSIDGAIRAGASKVVSYTDCLDENGEMADFSKARRESFRLASKEWILWLDTDDDLSNWNDLSFYITHMQNLPEKSCLIMMYDYTWSEDRSVCFQSFEKMRILRKSDEWVWKNPVHESLEWDGKEEIPKGIGAQTIRVIHLSSGSRGGENLRNFKILKRWEQAEPANPIVNYYLGDEFLFNLKDCKTAKECYLKSSLTYPGKYHEILQKRAAFRYFNCMFEMGDIKVAIEEIKKYLSKTKNAEANFYWILALFYNKMKNEKLAKHYFLKSKNRPLIEGENPHIGILIGKEIFGLGQ